jgi:L,D-transpeptidase ErfK/SrfK
MFDWVRKSIFVLFVVAWFCLSGDQAFAFAYSYHFPGKDEGLEESRTVIGFTQSHTVKPEETLLDIARHYGLGFNELQLLYPTVDPWIPKPGQCLDIPTQWILPKKTKGGIVINVPEFRLYWFIPKTRLVSTYPVGIGVLDWRTPEGRYRVVERELNPTWEIPKSLQEKYGVAQMPPGPDNPLGDRWLGLSGSGYGIHGTNFPWGVGRLVSHGCIRLYPEHIERLFDEVTMGTPVEIIYEPVKIGVMDGKIYIEVHPDIYAKIPNQAEYARNRIEQWGLLEYVSSRLVMDALRKCNGVPVPIGIVPKGGDKDLAWKGGKMFAASGNVIFPVNTNFKEVER